MSDNLIETVVFLLSIVAIFAGIVVLFAGRTSNLPFINKFKESRVLRAAVSVICVLLAWLFPWISVKTLLAVLAFILLISIFPIKKSFTHVSILIVVIFFGLTALGLILISVGFYTYQGVEGVSNGISRIVSNLPINVYNTAENYPISIQDERIMPDKKISIKDVDNVRITVKGGIELEFTNDDTLYVPSELEVKKDNQSLTISEPNPKQNVTYVIELGTNSHRVLDIKCAGIKITGSGNFKNFNLNSAGSLINADLLSENNVYINCAGLELTGKLQGKVFNINSAGTNLNGELNFDKIVVNSTGLTVNARSRFNDFNVSSTGLYGKIEILNSSNESGDLSVGSTGGSLTVVNKNKAPIDINTSGFIKITRE